MKLSEQIKPTGYLKDHIEEIIQGFEECPATYIITQDGTAKAIFQDIASYERTQETMKMLVAYAAGLRQVVEGKVQPAEEVLAEMRQPVRESHVLQSVID
jgi:hypothetical protein